MTSRKSQTLNRRSAVLSIAVVAGLLAAAPLSSVVAAPKGGVVTSLSIVDPASNPIEGNTGELDVRFVATPSVIPGWFDIDASFRPSRLVHTFSVFGQFFFGTVRGDAKVTVRGVQPGGTALVTATGMRAGSGADARPLTLTCLLTVDGGGHVTVLALSLVL